MIYYPKSKLKLKLTRAISTPDYVDTARLYTLERNSVYKKHELNIPEYMIKNYEFNLGKYSLFWLFNYEMALNNSYLYVQYFWEKI